jgi:hypothetical protein
MRRCIKDDLKYKGSFRLTYEDDAPARGTSVASGLHPNTNIFENASPSMS